MQSVFKLPDLPVVRGRQDILIEQCVGKRVLHIGCVDTGLVEQRFISGELLHQRLDVVASEVWGIDNNVEGIEFLRSKGFHNLFEANAEKLNESEELKNQGFDVLVASELIEHLSNPGLFLDGVQELMSPNETELIVTVPNAFRIRTVWGLFRDVEIVHPDHNYWFSYHTIVTLMQKHGFFIKRIVPYTFHYTTIWNKPAGKSYLRHLLALPKRLFYRTLFKISSFWCDGLIVIAQIPSDHFSVD